MTLLKVFRPGAIVFLHVYQIEESDVNNRKMEILKIYLPQEKRIEAIVHKAWSVRAELTLQHLLFIKHIWWVLMLKISLFITI
jgi:hypothetical protein